jgi:hypothetical protein
MRGLNFCSIIIHVIIIILKALIDEVLITFIFLEKGRTSIEYFPHSFVTDL